MLALDEPAMPGPSLAVLPGGASIVTLREPFGTSTESPEGVVESE